MRPEIIDVLIIEDDHQLAQLHAEMLVKHPWLRLAGIASSLSDARQLLRDTQPQLVLLDNYLPDGKGITLLESLEIKSLQCSIIFITAASDMDTCSTAIRSGAFDYLLKPISRKRLDHSLQRFIKFYEQQRIWKVVDQQSIDSLFSLQAADNRNDHTNKGIENSTLQKIMVPFNNYEDDYFSIDEIVTHTGLSKTTLRRYMEYAVSCGLLSVDKSYGQPGQPRRIYRLAKTKDN